MWDQRVKWWEAKYTYAADFKYQAPPQSNEVFYGRTPAARAAVSDRGVALPQELRQRAEAGSEIVGLLLKEKIRDHNRLVRVDPVGVYQSPARFQVTPPADSGSS